MKNFYIRFAVFCSFTVFTSYSLFAQCSCSGGTTPNSVTYLQQLNKTNAASSTISFPQFNPALGTLVCVKLEDTISGVTNSIIQNAGSTKNEFNKTVDKFFAQPFRIIEKEGRFF